MGWFMVMEGFREFVGLLGFFGVSGRMELMEKDTKRKKLK